MSLFFLYLVVILCATINAEKTDPKDNQQAGIELNKNFTHELLEGDMIFPKSGLPLFRYLPQGSPLFWPNHRIPYEMSSPYTDHEKSVFNQAVNWFNSKTCIRWVPKTSTDHDFVNIQKEVGCRAAVGRIGGGQLLSLIDNCFLDLYAVIHEMMHATGFIHEHQRPDRDNYVAINLTNVMSGNEIWFSISSDTRLFHDYKLPYDIHSVMHYDEKAFSKGTGNTIVAKNGQKLNCHHLAQCPTDLDAKKINSIYKC